MSVNMVKGIILGSMICALLSLISIAKADCTTEVGQESIQEQMEIKTDVPKYLEGATITVKLKDGKESTVPAEKFKVVPRLQQFFVTKTVQENTTMCKNDKNRISVLGGHGRKDGLKTNTGATNTTVENRAGLVMGAQYQRMLNDTLSVGGQVQTNKTGSVMLGIDF